MSSHDHTPAPHDHVDSWHHHAAAEGVPQHEHAAMLDIKVITLWGAGTAVGMILFMIVLALYFSHYTTALKADREERVAWQGLSRDVREARDTAEAVLSTNGKRETYAWVQGAEGRVQIPIDKAMRKVVNDYAGRTNEQAK